MIPLVVYRVYPDGRPDELIRGVSIVGTPLASFGNIVATSDKSEIFNGICGAESGSVPVAAISPALLVSSIEIQRKERSQDQPPYLPRPEAQALMAPVSRRHFLIVAGLSAPVARLLGAGSLRGRRDPAGHER